MPETVINTRDIIKMIKNGDTANSPGRLATSIREIMKAMFEVAMAKCFGPMEATTKDSGSMAFSTEKVSNSYI